MTRQFLRRNWEGVSLVAVVLFTIVGCGGSGESPSTSESGLSSRSTSAGKSSEEGRGTSPSLPAGTNVGRESTSTTLATSPGIVLAGKDVGMTVSGKGAVEPERSLEVLEQKML